MDKHTRRVSGLLGDFADWRDLHRCRLTGGTPRDLDHVQAHHTGGQTSARNTQALARRTHTVKDHPDVHVRTVDPDLRDELAAALADWPAHSPDTAWTMPSGHTIQRPPPPALDHGSTPITADEQEQGRT